MGDAMIAFADSADKQRNKTNSRGDSYVWKVCLFLIRTLFGQLIYFFVLMGLEVGGVANVIPQTMVAAKRLSPKIYWGTLIAGLVGALFGYGIGKTRERGTPWYRFRIQELLLLTCLVAVYLAMHNLLYRLPLSQ
jgi:hypothetical protein